MTKKNPPAISVADSAIYAITTRSKIEKWIAKDGQGQLLENKPWATAKNLLERAVQVGERLPILLADGANIMGIEWIGFIDTIEISEDGKSSISVSSIRSLPGKQHPLHKLKKLSDGLLLSDSFRRSYVPCHCPVALRKILALKAYQKAKFFDELDDFSVAQYEAALDAIFPTLTESQQAMLVGHGQAFAATLSMAKIASLGKYKSFETANIQYGRLGRRFATYFGIPTNKTGPTQAIAVAASNSDSLGHFQWTLRPRLVSALRNLGLLPATKKSLEEAVAEAEISVDPECIGIPETTRQALVQARIGQGKFRKSMLAIWHSRCAVTGCSVQTVLIASHAKAWSSSKNDERLDPYNGLLLSASLDRLFDKGFISFSDDGLILRKQDLSTDELARLGIGPRVRIIGLHPKHIPYLAAHRKAWNFDVG